MITSLVVISIYCFPCVSGDARLAKNVKNKVFSFDLVSNNPSVIACDMANVCYLFMLPLMVIYNGMDYWQRFFAIKIFCFRMSIIHCF